MGGGGGYDDRDERRYAAKTDLGFKPTHVGADILLKGGWLIAGL